MFASSSCVSRALPRAKVKCCACTHTHTPKYDINVIFCHFNVKFCHKRFAGPGGTDRRPAAILLLDKIQLPAAQDKEYA